MAIQINDVIYWDEQSFVNTTEKTSVVGEFRGVEGVIFKFYTDVQIITYRIEILTGKTGYRQIAEGTVKADELEVVNIPFAFKAAKVFVTAKVAPTVVTVDALGYPAVFARDKDGNIVC
jgi:hypothetical protein